MTFIFLLIRHAPMCEGMCVGEYRVRRKTWIRFFQLATSFLSLRSFLRALTKKFLDNFCIRRLLLFFTV